MSVFQTEGCGFEPRLLLHIRNLTMSEESIVEKEYSVNLRTLSFIFNEQNEVLLLERAGDMFDGGMFNALGGHIERGENLFDGAIREVVEEAGFTPDKNELAGIVHVTNFFGNNVVVVVTKSFTDKKDFVDSEEGKLKWVKIEDLEKYNVYKDLKIYMDRILNNKKKFSGVGVFDGKGGLVSLDLKDLD